MSSKKANSLPAAAVEAFSTHASEPLQLNKADLAFFKGFVDKGSASAPPPAARYLRLIRRLSVMKAPWGTGIGENIVATVDLSQLPDAWASWKSRDLGYPYVLLLLKDMFEALLKSMAITPRTFVLGSGFFSFSVRPPDAKRALPLAELHEPFIADGPLFLRPVSKTWALYEPLTVKNFENATAQHRKLSTKRGR